MSIVGLEHLVRHHASYNARQLVHHRSLAVHVGREAETGVVSYADFVRVAAETKPVPELDRLIN
jgi:hypothetical protein